MGAPVTLVDPDGHYVDISGGGGAAEVEVTNFPATQAVSGPLTQTQFNTSAGVGSSPVYTDATGAASGTMIGLLKGIFVQLAAINAKTPTP